MDTTNITIETENLYLQSNALKYQDVIFVEFTPEITTYMMPKSATDISETIAFIETAMKENKEGRSFQIVVLNKKSGEFLGCGGMHNIDQPTPELGIWIKKSAHGHGYGKEAMVALKEWADQNLNYEYILYPVAVQNIPSRKIPEFLGGTIVKEYDQVNMSGNKLHFVEYHIYPTKKL